MNLYDILADEYSALFPLDNEQVEFITRLFPHKGTVLTDAGCATGDLARALAANGYTVTGIDSDARMIELARRKNAGSGAVFRVMDLSETASLARTDGLLCFGNTIPHLGSTGRTANFFDSVYTILEPGGLFVCELLNYDRIRKNHGISFGTIETHDVLFRRKYVFLDDGRISFEICLEKKASRESYTGATVLLPLEQDTLLNLLHGAGFTDARAYADYKLHPSDRTEFATVYVCKKAADDQLKRGGQR